MNYLGEVCSDEDGAVGVDPKKCLEKLVIVFSEHMKIIEVAAVDLT